MKFFRDPQTPKYIERLAYQRSLTLARDDALDVTLNDGSELNFMGQSDPQVFVESLTGGTVRVSFEIELEVQEYAHTFLEQEDGDA